MHGQPKDLILDIETLGLKPGATILEISAWCGGHGLTISIDPKSHPGTFDLPTLLWWSTVPSEEAKKHAFGSDVKRCPLEVAICRFDEFIREHKPDFFWGCSPDFDFGHLEFWFKFYGKEIPWKYHQLRDVRTIRDFLPKEKLDSLIAKTGSFGEFPHMASFDADLERRIVDEVRTRFSLAEKVLS